MTTKRVSRLIRQQVRERAGNRCEYCCLPDSIRYHAFHVDHIIALKHQGTNELDNLAWACMPCNINKSSDIASYEAGKLVRLFNPRKDIWWEHFAHEAGVLQAQTDIARVTIRLLRLNESDRIETRLTLYRLGLY